MKWDWLPWKQRARAREEAQRALPETTVSSEPLPEMTAEMLNEAIGQLQAQYVDRLLWANMFFPRQEPTIEFPDLHHDDIAAYWRYGHGWYDDNDTGAFTNPTVS